MNLPGLETSLRVRGLTMDDLTSAADENFWIQNTPEARSKQMKVLDFVESGQLKSVPKTLGAHLETALEGVVSKYPRERLGEVADAVGAALMSLANPLGISSYAREKTGDQQGADMMRAQQQASPLGDILGAVVPAAATGGAGAIPGFLRGAMRAEKVSKPYHMPHGVKDVIDDSKNYLDDALRNIENFRKSGGDDLSEASLKYQSVPSVIDQAEIPLKQLHSASRSGVKPTTSQLAVSSGVGAGAGGTAAVTSGETDPEKIALSAASGAVLGPVADKIASGRPQKLFAKDRGGTPYEVSPTEVQQELSRASALRRSFDETGDVLKSKQATRRTEDKARSVRERASAKQRLDDEISKSSNTAGTAAPHQGAKPPRPPKALAAPTTATKAKRGNQTAGYQTSKSGSKAQIQARKSMSPKPDQTSGDQSKSASLKSIEKLAKGRARPKQEDRNQLASRLTDRAIKGEDIAKTAAVLSSKSRKKTDVAARKAMARKLSRKLSPSQVKDVTNKVNDLLSALGGGKKAAATLKKLQKTGAMKFGIGATVATGAVNSGDE